jgi:hypothetical protein
MLSKIIFLLSWSIPFLASALFLFIIFKIIISFFSGHSMLSKRIFSWLWLALFLASSLVLFIILKIIISLFAISGWYVLLTLLLLPLFIFLIWKNRVEVDPETELVVEFFKEKVEPLKNGYHFPQKFLTAYHEKKLVPTNERSLYILSGRREGLEPEDIKLYLYGDNSDMEPGTGDSLRLKYIAVVQCVNSSTFSYRTVDPYGYAANIIEHAVEIYVHSLSSEEIIDGFNKQDVSIIPNSFLEDILQTTGLEVVKFIPGDPILNPETEKMRIELESKKRQVEITRADADNKVELEKGRRKVIDERIVTADRELQLAAKSNKVVTERIAALKDSGLSETDALSFIMREKTLETINEASGKGGLVYIDEGSKNGNLSQSASMGFAINAMNNNQKK